MTEGGNGVERQAETTEADRPAASERKGRLFVISGPSGSGKSTLSREAIKRTEARLSVSATTRPRSDKEVEGKDYYFLSEEEFINKIKAEEFLEYAHVFGHYYGTPGSVVRNMLSQGHTVVLEIDVQGAAEVFKRFDSAVGILVLPPDDEELRRRLVSRARDDEETIAKRLAKAQWEIKQAQAGGRYQHTVTNDDLNQAIEAVVRLIG